MEEEIKDTSKSPAHSSDKETIAESMAKIPSFASAASTPLSILAAGVIIALAIVYSVAKSPERIPADRNIDERAAVQDIQDSGQQQQAAPVKVNIRPISADDHIFGNKNAPVKIVEFSDTECPYCKYFHATLQQVVAGSNGQIAWVYRHFPLEQLHPKAQKEAEATECAFEQGGNDKFWAYINKIFEVTPSNNQLDLAELPKIAVQVGLDKAKFEACLESGKYTEKVKKDTQDAIAAGGRGTPFSVIVTSSGKTSVVSGALSAEQVKSKVAEALSN